MIVNIRGTGGSGKSTLVRRVMELYWLREPLMMEGRRRPYGYRLRAEGRRTLYVVGHYETACGGGDTIKTVDEVFLGVEREARLGHDVLFEGIMSQDDVRRTIGLKDLGLLIVMLTTPVAECLDAIRARRATRPNAPPLKEHKTVTRAATVRRSCDRLAAAGVSVERLDREAAFQRVKELLCS